MFTGFSLDCQASDGTCKRLDIDPWVYLRDIFARIGAHKHSRLAEPLPDKWRAGRTPPDHS